MHADGHRETTRAGEILHKQARAKTFSFLINNATPRKYGGQRRVREKIQ
jgi:hypothetical protein